MKSAQKNITLLLLTLTLSFQSFAQENETYTSKSNLTIGLNVNPLLLVVYNRIEAGPSFNYEYTINKRIEAGATLFARQLFTMPNNEYKQVSNVQSTINLETVLMPYVGLTFGEKRIRNKALLFAGARHDFYKEKLINNSYGINEDYGYNEVNFMFGMGYQFQYLLKNGNRLSFRLLMPMNRHPFDDTNRYSMELGYTIALKNGKNKNLIRQ